MVSFTVLLLLPLLVLLSLPWLDRRKVWTCLPLTFLADVDYFVGQHREWMHNVWTLLPFLALLAQGHRTENRAWVQWGLISSAIVASHLVMDVFVGGETLFWPVSDYNVCAYFAINVLTRTNTPQFDFGNCSAPGAPTVSEVYTFLDYQETAEWAFVLTVCVALAAWQFFRGGGLRFLRKQARE